MLGRAPLRLLGPSLPELPSLDTDSDAVSATVHCQCARGRVAKTKQSYVYQHDLSGLYSVRGPPHVRTGSKCLLGHGACR